MYGQVVKLLTTEWLVSDVDLIVEGDFIYITSPLWLSADLHTESRRRFHLIRIRQIYIPELILRLHNILFTSRQMIPECVKYLFIGPKKNLPLIGI